MVNFLFAYWIVENFHHLDHDVLTASRFGYSWQYESWNDTSAMKDLNDVGTQPFHKFVIKRNGKVIYVDDSQREAGALISAKFLNFALPYLVLAHRAHSQSGHGQYTTYFRIKDRFCVNMGSIDIECGGPVFQDIDQDGSMEWLFDDYDHYKYHGAPPKWLLVYKVSSKGKLYLWKKLPNKKEIRLKDTVGLAS